jgi:hypothetical protein
MCSEIRALRHDYAPPSDLPWFIVAPTIGLVENILTVVPVLAATIDAVNREGPAMHEDVMAGDLSDKPEKADSNVLDIDIVGCECGLLLMVNVCESTSR